MDQLRSLAERYHLHLDDAALSAEQRLLGQRMGALERVEQLPRRAPRPARGTRKLGSRPDDESDPSRAWLRRCLVHTDETGLLDNVTVAVKDNVAVGGIPMTCSARPLEHYVPEGDAFVVDQILADGGTIIGKTNLDEMAVSGSGEITLRGPIPNPHDSEYLAGGSSGGSAVAVVTGDADVAVGTDQAGSLRVPAAWCGCVGLKPTHGLLSYRGCVGLGHSFDHVGPMARTVSETARLLSAMTGRDPDDPRQAPVESKTYHDDLDVPVEDITVGVLAEGMAAEHMDPAVRDPCEMAIAELEAAGAAVEEVSVPPHEDGLAISLACQVEEIVSLWESEGTGHFVGGVYDTQFASAFSQARRADANSFSPTVQHLLLLGGYLKHELQGRYHGLASNLRHWLRNAYDGALGAVDALAMPTTPMTAFERVEVETREQLVNRAQGKEGRTRNTLPFDMTGHPAITVPVGTADGLPIGLSLVGSHFDESRLLAIAAAVESRTEYDPTPIDSND